MFEPRSLEQEPRRPRGRKPVLPNAGACCRRSSISRSNTKTRSRSWSNETRARHAKTPLSVRSGRCAKSSSGRSPTGQKHLRPERVSAGLLKHKQARLEYHPLGVVVAAIIPWNYPFQNFVNAIPPALMAGNAIVIKPSEWVAWSSARFAEMFRRVLEAAGHNPDLIQIVQGYGQTGSALVRSHIDTVLFIGSVNNGRKVIEASAERGRPRRDGAWRQGRVHRLRRRPHRAGCSRRAWRLLHQLRSKLRRL